MTAKIFTRVAACFKTLRQKLWAHQTPQCQFNANLATVITPETICPGDTEWATVTLSLASAQPVVLAPAKRPLVAQALRSLFIRHCHQRPVQVGPMAPADGLGHWAGKWETIPLVPISQAVKSQAQDAPTSASETTPETGDQALDELFAAVNEQQLVQHTANWAADRLQEVQDTYMCTSIGPDPDLVGEYDPATDPTGSILANMNLWFQLEEMALDAKLAWEAKLAVTKKKVAALQAAQPV
ncbi:hypothetical protein IWQ60_008208 [Tieghemiomyces parasiticus]|uniref:Uncharacterized protein n=1 Tax=Tieghemiomyces parasiticus TaxID=78921 RepID=A0A9W7ZZT5_9FUNG|nr:hypothetical protein IWQ60_008208 [Tieghemiomyces parasiticus]